MLSIAQRVITALAGSPVYPIGPDMTALESLNDYAREPQHAYGGNRRDRSAPKAFAALRAVLARHSDDGGGNCTECLRCRPGRDSAVEVPYPCATARDIAKELE